VREWFRLALGEPTAAQPQRWPVTATEGAELLAAAGFVHDYVGMTFYSGVG